MTMSGHVRFFVFKFSHRRSATMRTIRVAAVFAATCNLLLIALTRPLTAAEPEDPNRPGAIATSGVPVVPPELVNRLTQYQNMRSAEFLGWSNEPGAESGMLIRTRFGNSVQLHRVDAPG